MGERRRNKSRSLAALGTTRTQKLARIMIAKKLKVES